jgi:phosphoesterase RecJ-like protein
VLSLGVALDRLGKTRSLIMPDAVPHYLGFLPGIERLEIGPVDLPQADLAIVPDCSDLGRLGPFYDQHRTLLDSLPTINIDHHPSNGHFGTVNIVDERAAACCEQLADLLPMLEVQVEPTIATCLLTGIVTDTQNFRTPNTTTRTMRVATTLMEAGAPLGQIADTVYNSRSVGTLRLWGLALNRLEEAGGVVWCRLDGEMLRQSGTGWDEAEALTNLLSSVRSADAAILFKVLPDGTTRVSLRSNGKINVAVIAQQFGGGGHVGAAGCTLTEPFLAASANVLATVQAAVSLARHNGAAG